MLPKTKRIPRSLFSEILTSRRFAHSAHFSLRIGNSSQTAARAAVSVSKKVSKSAVVRNTIRRRVYSTLAHQATPLRASLYLVVAKAGADKVKGEALAKEISALLKAAERS